MHEHSEKRLLLGGLLAACLLAGCRPLTDDADAGPDAQVKDDPVQSDKDGPLVSVLAPLDGTDPNAGDVLVEPQIEVRCGASARNAERPVNPGSVKVRVFAAGESKAALTLQALARGNDTYAAEISLLELPAGRLRIECSARDTGPNARGGLASIETLFDTGPQVVFETPAPGTAIAHKAGAVLAFLVNEQKLAPDDVQAGVESVQLRINGREVTGVRTDAAGRYSYQLDLSDTALYPATLEALQVEVRASNGRSPQAAVRSAVLEVPVDGQGPEIRVTRPKDASFVGQLAEVVARITDDVAGVQESSVRVTVSVDDIADAFPMTMGASEQEFVASFPTAKYEARAQLTLNVIAEDKAGNETRASSVVFVDSVPPWVSLDPPPVRLLTEHSERGTECSAPFDPVGDDAIDDLSVVDSLFARYRVLAWERGITLDGQSIVHLSDLDEKSVALFVQGNPAIPLIVDSDGDGVCDGVDQEPIPVGPENDPIKVSLDPARSRGKPPAGSFSAASDLPDTSGRCALSTATKAPEPLCTDTTMTYVLEHTAEEVSEVVYALHPQSSGVGCTGDAWQATVDDGWTCVAAVATDQAGNLGFSLPLRVCYELSSGASGCSAPPPSCTDGCRMPESTSARGMPALVPAP